MNTRATAAKIIFEVMHRGRSLSDVLKSTKKDAQSDAFVQAVCYGVCRWYTRLNAITQLLLEKPLKAKDQDIHALILVGLYQLMDMSVPDYAAIGETVSATKAFKKIWAKGLVNGVLREYQRRAEELNAAVQKNHEANSLHPEWMINKIQHDWPSDWETILDANNQHPPFALRVNQKFNSREDYIKPLEAVSVIAETHSGFILETPTQVSALPGFANGSVSVQDGAAQLAAELLMLEPGQRVLDACAAPGGKTAHILESESQLSEVIAIDKDEQRLTKIVENLNRLQLKAKCICADAGDLTSWWDGKLFDRVLLDAPCSASGVIRRHPDIKLLRRESDLLQLPQEQSTLLNAMWQVLKPGGILLYATCSIFHAENDEVLNAFLQTHPDAKEEKINTTWGKELSVGRQILPGMHRMDGFYYARLRKCEL